MNLFLHQNMIKMIVSQQTSYNSFKWGSKIRASVSGIQLLLIKDHSILNMKNMTSDYWLLWIFAYKSQFMANWNVTTKFYLKVPYLLKVLSYYHELESTMSLVVTFLSKNTFLKSHRMARRYHRVSYKWAIHKLRDSPSLSRTSQ